VRRHLWIGAFLTILIAGSQGLGREPRYGEPAPNGFFQRWHPVGGWDPYGGGLLRWWPAHCFPRCGAADDYCRKPLPRLCWPAYPPYYIWGPPEICYPQCNGSRGEHHPSH
jgi:hypothetical protein